MMNMQQTNRATGPLGGIRKKALLFVALFFLAGGTMLYAQGRKVTLQVKNANLETVLSSIKEQSGLKLIYKVDAVNSVNGITLSVKDLSAKEAVDLCLQGTSLTATMKDGSIVITKVVNNGGQVTGKVVDADNFPMVGVNVAVIKNKQVVTGVTTDMDGEFTLNVPSGSQLRFTFVGYKDVVLTPSTNKAMNIRMVEDSNAMEEVVVNGFFTRQKQSFTGAARSYKSEELLSVSPTNLFQALATLDPGMTITKNNAAGSNPNNIPDLVIRSTTSLSTSGETGLNSPLIVIDGVESTLTALYDLDMQDIERVDVLKDASASALYGENAANGVIIIERKRVSQAPVRVRYTFTPTLSFADLSSYKLCNSAQKLELERLAGLYDSTTGSMDESYYEKLAYVSQGIDVDWISKPVRDSFSQKHSMTVSGRGSGLEYNVTGSYGLTNGVMKDDARNTYGLSVYLSYRAVKKLTLSLRASHDQVDTRDSKYGSFSSYVSANPYDSPYDEMGNLRKSLSYNENNPLYEASLSSFSKSQTRTESISLDGRYDFKPTLYVTGQVAYSTSRGTSDEFKSPESNTYANTTDLTKKGYYQLGNTGSTDWSAKLVGNWINKFDDKGTMLTLNLGGEIKKSDSYSRYLTASGFLSDELSDIAYASAYSSSSMPGGSESLSTSVGAFAAANFIYRNRYIVDGSYRLSGSSKFGENNRYAPFWSVGAGWNLHNEAFIKKLDWVNSLKLRASYGYTGSVKFNAYQAMTTYYYTSSAIHYTGVGAIPYAMSNPDLKWQTTKKLNVGLTSELLKNRLNVNFDVYNEVTDDMLIDISLPPSAGATSVKYNMGKQESNGYEFSVWGKMIQTKNWMWTATVNGLHSKTTIKNISDALKRLNEENSLKASSTPSTQYREGESPTAIYAVRSAGIDPASGQEIFITKDGAYTYTYNAEDQVSCGDTNPTLQGSISSLVAYKNWSLNVNFSYRYGGQVFNSTRRSKVEGINPQQNADKRAFTERWKQPGDVVPYLAISITGGTSSVYSDRFVEDDDELWLSNLSLQYNLPEKWNKYIGLQKTYVSLGAEDLLRFNSSKYERGTSYPYSRSVNLSFSVIF
jgi:TonB-linked SusC/RagA family outer membrane protein